jgi:hypothetical protein
MTDEAISPLRRRMIEDVTIRKLAPKTQQGDIQTIKDLAAFLGRSPDTANISHEKFSDREFGFNTSSCNSWPVAWPRAYEEVEPDRHVRATVLNGSNAARAQKPSAIEPPPLPSSTRERNGRTCPTRVAKMPHGFLICS